VFDDDAEVPDPILVSDLPFTSRLTATEVWRGGAETKVFLKWTGFALYWNVYWRRTAGGAVGAWRNQGRAYQSEFELGGFDYGVTYDFAVTHTENPADGATVSLQLRGKIDPPGDVLFADMTLESYGILIEWTRVFDFDVAGYELRVGTDWDTATALVRTAATNYRWNIQVAGTHTVLIKAYDAFGNESVNAKSVSETIASPSQVIITYVFSGQNAVLSWSAATGAFPIAEYEISYGPSYTFVDSTKTQGYSTKVDWSGTRTYYIRAIDIAGNYGSYAAVDIVVTPPGIPVSLTAEVIDNNVLLRWSTPTTGSLPIQYYEVRRGAAFATATVVGQASGTFSAIFEGTGGDFVYWVVGVDTAGNYGTEASIAATVSEPPDYTEGTKLVLPVNLTETYAEHFTDQAWSSMQDAIDAGFAYFPEKVPTGGYYEEVFDYGTTISASTKVELSRGITTIDGSPTITPKISVSLNGSSWTDYDDVWEVVESNFRYVKIRVTVSGTGNDDFITIDSLVVKLDLKVKNDQGRVQVLDQGQIEYFNVAFLDVISLTLTPESPDSGATVLVALYDFYDAPNPTAFQIYIFDAETGLYVDNIWVSWTARGV
jgi:hypothetical protein